MNSLKIFFVTFLFLLTILAGILYPTKSSAYDNYDFWIQTPTNWNNKTDGLNGGLKKQVMAPDGNAFIEVYAHSGNNPGLQNLADKMEQGIKDRGGIYFQNRITSKNVQADGHPAIFREYSCNYNGNKLRSCALYTYANGGAVVAIGVYVESLAQKYHNLVYRSIGSLRFTPPPTMSANDPYGTMPPAHGNNNNPYASDEGVCDLIVGKWKWFTNSVVEFQHGGRMPGNGNYWKCVDSNQRKFVVNWGNGKWIDNLILSQDGNRLDGKNQIGNKVWGTRLSGSSAPPTPPSAPQAVPKMNYAKEIKGNMSASWRLAHGSIKPSDPSEWELSTVAGTTLRFTDPYKKGAQRYRVKITTKNRQPVEERVIGMSEHITIGPGIYNIKVLPEGGYAGWRCEWH
ncbi:hypothetical protein [Maridesulfovibrio zosterae]|uniref:hypothetical protein n=1 Tax=Maridesulfovibrio zosterae TaxID=82171 RepID=UPI00041EC5DA|nr:hypothetical protein [Maridesulfovibrio zosterae]